MTSQATVLAPVYPSMRNEELGRLLREAGYQSRVRGAPYILTISSGKARGSRSKA